jgi:hypothetical protein
MAETTRGGAHESQAAAARLSEQAGALWTQLAQFKRGQAAGPAPQAAEVAPQAAGGAALVTSSFANPGQQVARVGL